MASKETLSTDVVQFEGVVHPWITEDGERFKTGATLVTQKVRDFCFRKKAEVVILIPNDLPVWEVMVFLDECSVDPAYAERIFKDERSDLHYTLPGEDKVQFTPKEQTTIQEYMIVKTNEVLENAIQFLNAS